MTQPSLQVSARFSGDRLELRTLSAHPMETGRRHDESGQLVAAHYITSFVVAVNGKTIIEIDSGPGLSANPTLGFRLAGVKHGDQITVAWTDNVGTQARQTVQVESFG